MRFIALLLIAPVFVFAGETTAFNKKHAQSQTVSANLPKKNAENSGPSVEQFVRAAILKADPAATKVQMVRSYNPLTYFTRLVAPIGNALNSEKVEYSFYRVQYLDGRSLELQNCLAGVGYKPSFGRYFREVYVGVCNTNIFSSQQLVHADVCLDPECAKTRSLD